MTNIEKAIEHLQSIVIIAVEAQEALRAGDFEAANECMDDIERDLKLATQHGLGA